MSGTGVKAEKKMRDRVVEFTYLIRGLEVADRAAI
jgi:hypothetical protein